MDLNTIASVLAAADKEIEAQNPYFSASDLFSSLGDAPIQMRSSAAPGRYGIGESAGTSAIAGLLSGIFSGIGQNYQQERGEDVAGMIDSMLMGQMPERPEGMSASLYNRAAIAGKLFNRAQALEQVAEARKIKNLELEEKAKRLGQISGDMEGSKMAGGGPGALFGDKLVDYEKAIYDRITKSPLAIDFNAIDVNFKTLQRLATQDNPSANVGMIATLARIWDPKGTVQKGEYDLNAEAQSALDSIYGDWRKVVMGDGELGEAAKSNILLAAAQKYNEFGSKYAQERKAHYDAFKMRGGDPVLIPTSEYQPFDPAEILKILSPGTAGEKYKLPGATQPTNPAFQGLSNRDLQMQYLEQKARERNTVG